MTRLRLLVVLTALALAVAGCGIQPESRPTAIAVPTLTTTAAAPDAERGGPREVTVYFVQDGRLASVERDVEDVSLENRIGLLLVGPLSSEAAEGVSTAVPPQSLRPVVVDATSGVAYVEATPAFTRVTGPNQLLAVAQVVWTVTEHRSSDKVSITVDGHALEVPTDDGLSRVPVSRDQFMSVAPLQATAGSS